MKPDFQLLKLNFSWCWKIRDGFTDLIDAIQDKISKREEFLNNKVDFETKKKKVV
jgi:hypothetical protein